MKVIMVPVADRPECRIALKEAFRLARVVSANIVGYHLRPHREEQVRSHWPRLTDSVIETGIPETSEKASRLNTANAERLFRSTAAEHDIPIARKPRVSEGPLAYWHVMVGTPEKLFSIIGPTSDCIVVSRPKARASGPGRAFLLAALLRGGKPLLVLPQKPQPRLGQRILIAWNQGIPVASAVTAALPLLQRAEEVHLVCCGDESSPGPKMAHAGNYLLHWGIESRQHRCKGRDPAAEIMETYRKLGCGLLVMGAYSRSHLRERILGGVTHRLLAKADVPVFALHA
ncbi:MAG: universal stress protein [Gammaproteobacteria bacterium]|nr:universal stress protein [Gammaproteobacteria bacterium]NNK32869.1 universal stress protein [Xanthomonadales bacterium]